MSAITGLSSPIQQVAGVLCCNNTDSNPVMRVGQAPVVEGIQVPQGIPARPTGGRLK